MSLKLLTYEEVVSGDFAKEKAAKTKKGKWSLYIKSAKKMKENINQGNARMAIAELAERSCHIYWGGDYRTEEFKKFHKPKTLKAFATRIGVPYGTLNQWTLTKKRVFDHLSADQKKDFKINAGYMASLELTPVKSKNKVGHTTEEIQTIYTELRYQPDSTKRQKRNAVNDFTKAVYRLFYKKFYDDLADEQKERVQESITIMYSFLNARKKIEKIRQKQAGTVTN